MKLLSNIRYTGINERKQEYGNMHSKNILNENWTFTTLTYET